MLMNNNKITPHLHYAGSVASVLIHGPLLRLVILCSLFSPPSHPLRMLLSLPEADPVDRIDRAPAGYWLTSVSVWTTGGTSGRRETDRPRLGEWTERRDEGTLSLLALQVQQLWGPAPSGLRVTVAYL